MNLNPSQYDAAIAEDRKTVIHPFTPLKEFESGSFPSVMVENGEGLYIYDKDGRKILDGFSGLYCVNVGHGRKEIAEAMYKQALKLPFYHSYAGFTNEPLIELTTKMLKFMPFQGGHAFYGVSGSDANETQVKLIWYYNNVLGKQKAKKIISRKRGYHGCSIFSGSLTGLPFYHTNFDLPVSAVLHTTNPHFYWEAEEGMTEMEFSAKCARDLEDMILAEGAENIGAFIGEPVLGTGGIIPPPEGYWLCIQEVLKKYDVPLISDEVICGFGRLGSNTGAEMYGMKPDFVTLAKGLTSAYAPLSAAVVSPKVWEVLLRGADKFGAFSHGYTYSGHPIGTSAGVANLNIIEREGIVENARKVGKYFQEQLKKHFDGKPFVAEVRGVGMLGAIEFTKERKVRFDAALKVGPRMSAACFKRGLIARGMPHGDILGFAPPLISKESDIDTIIGLAKEAYEEVSREISGKKP